MKDSALLRSRSISRMELTGDDAAGEITDVVMQVLNRLLYTGLVNVAERLVPAKRGDRC